MRRICFLLTLLMLCSVSFAQTIGQAGQEISDINQKNDKLQFFIISPNEGNYTCCVRPRKGATGEVVVPTEIEVKTHHKFQVVRAERFGSIAGGGITKVTFPEGLQEISVGCFSGSTALTEFNIPASVTKIGEGAFAQCTSLTNIDVAEGNKNFKFDTYNGQKMLLSSNGTDLYCYLSCNVSDNTNEGYCTMPETVTCIHNGAITYNPNFTYLTIPKSVTTIHFPAIYKNGNHTTFTVEDGNENFGSDGGVLTDKDGKQILCVPYHMGKDVTVDGKNKRVFEINGNTGYNQINPNSFFYCDELTSIIIPEGITVIKDSAFNNCYNLEEVTLPASLETIEKNPFFRLSHLSAYHVTQGNKYFSDIDGVLFSSDKKKLIKYPLNKNKVIDTASPDYGTVSYVFPSDVDIEEIGEYAFNEASLKEITIPNTVKKIDDGAFQTCTRLKTITFDPTSQVTEIGMNAFQRCDVLENITIPASVTKIDQGAFYASGLKAVTVDGNAIESIGNQAFANCSNLTEFNIDENSKLQSLGQGVFLNDVGLTSFTLPKNVTSLGWSVFSGCKGLTNFKFAGEGVTSLSRYLFDHCEKLASITLPESLISIQAQAFANCTSLDKITIPSATTSVDHDSFRFCDNLKNIYVADGNTMYSSVDGMLCTGGDKHNEELYTMPPGRANSDYTLLPTIKTIGREACFWNQNLTNIAIPSSVENIEDNAFYGCDKLKTVTCMGSKAPTASANAFFYALTDDATLYYRKRDADAYKTWAGGSKFKYRHPSFNFAYQRSDRQNPDEDLVEYIPLSDNAVAIVSNESVDPETAGGKDFKQSTKSTLIIPDQVSDVFDGKTYTYTTKVVYDNAFTTNDKLSTLTFYGPITYIGVNAFHKRVANSGNATATEADQPAFSDGIYFVHNFPEGEGVLFAQDKYNLDDSYKAFAEGQKVYVKVSQKDAYENALNSEKHPCDVETDIPVKTKSANTRDPWGHYLYGLCREFATDFTDGNFTPYVPLAGTYKKVTDKEGCDHSFRAESTQTAPAFTGFILRSTNDDNQAGVYHIAEDQSSITSAVTTSDAIESNDLVMKGSYEETPILANDSYDYYGMKNSIFRMLNSGTTLPAFKTYLQMPKAMASSAKGISILFVDASTTGVSEIKNETVTLDSPVYDLNGRKVAESYNESKNSLPAGLYIVNGKKLVVK